MVWHDCKTDPPKKDGCYIGYYGNKLWEKFGTISSKIYGKTHMIQKHLLLNGQKLICRRLSKWTFDIN